MNTTDLFISDIIELSNREFSSKEIELVKRSLLDYIGVTLAGSKITNERIEGYLNEVGDYYAVGVNESTNFMRACFVNGYNSHVMELDDGHRYAMAHLSAPIFSALLVVAQKEKLSFENFVKGVIIGFEVEGRLAMAIQPSHKARGYHATGTCGTLGVAMAVGAALNYTSDEMKNALSAAATSAAGLLESIEGKSQMKPYNVAIAVQNGVTAAYFGKSGFCGPDDVIGGKRGFLKVMSDEVFVDKLKINKDDKLCIEQVYLKPYAACRHCHAPIEGALNLLKNNKFEIDSIKSVEIHTYKLAVFGHDHVEINGENSGKMSIPYSVAVALALNNADIDSFRIPYLEDRCVIELCKKVKVFVDPDLTAISPGIRAAIINVIFNDGSVISERVDYAKGEPENPISNQELIEKFVSLSKYSGRTNQDIENILECVKNIELDFYKLFKILYY